MVTGGMGGRRRQVRICPSSAAFSDGAKETWLKYLQSESRWTPSFSQGIIII